MIRATAVRIEVFLGAAGAGQRSFGQRAFGDLLGISQAAVWKYTKGGDAKRESVDAMIEATGGFVDRPHWGQFVKDSPALRRKLLRELQESDEAMAAVSALVEAAA